MSIFNITEMLNYVFFKRKGDGDGVLHSRTLVSRSGDLGSVPSLAVLCVTPARSLPLLCFSPSAAWYLRVSVTWGMLGCGAQRELDLGHCPSPYCKAPGAVAVVRMLLHVLANSLCFYRKCWMCTSCQQCGNVGYWYGIKETRSLTSNLL